MAKRSYRQYCALARALDIVGERWTLLLVRELVTGPKRYKDLLAALPGIGTNLLAARLKELADEGLIAQGRLPPPADVPVYELTELGEGLEPAILSLARWGQVFLGRPTRAQHWQPHWLAIALKYAFHAEAARGVTEDYGFEIDGIGCTAQVHDGEVQTVLGPIEDADLVLRTDGRTFLATAMGEFHFEDAEARGKLEVEGSRAALRRCRKIFKLKNGTWS